MSLIFHGQRSYPGLFNIAANIGGWENLLLNGWDKNGTVCGEKGEESEKGRAIVVCMQIVVVFFVSSLERCSPSRQTILVYERRLDDISPGGPLEKCSAFRREPPSSKKCARSMHFLRVVPTSNARWSSLASERQRKCRFSSRIERYPQRWIFLWKCVARVISANRATRVRGPGFVTVLCSLRRSVESQRRSSS